MDPTSVQMRNSETEKLFSRRRVKNSLDRVRYGQFRKHSLYNNLRGLVPLILLGLLWLSTSSWRWQELLGRAISVKHLLAVAGVVALWNVCFGLSIHDMRSIKADFLSEVGRLTFCSVACGGFVAFANRTGGDFNSRVLSSAYTTIGLLIGSLLLLSVFIVVAGISPRLLRRRAALIVGTGERANMLQARLRRQYSSFKLYGCVDNEYRGKDAEADKFLGTIDQLQDLLKRLPIEIVFIGLPFKSKYDDIQRVIQICESIGVESHYMKDIFDTSHAQVHADVKAPHHFVVLSTLQMNPTQHLKRVIDFLGALALLVTLSPVMIATAAALYICDPGPIFFVQQRYGRHRKRFPMFKFRSMIIDAEREQASLEALNEAQGPVFKLKADPRITRIGALLRKTSIDELPQLFNVLRGEMSLVGPRPLTLRDVSQFKEPWLLRRFSVRPGLTGIWQVSGRSNTSFDLWIQQDLTYIDQWSLVLDLKILLKTVPAVLKGSGAV